MKLEAATSDGAGESKDTSQVKVEVDDRAPTPLAIPPRLKTRSRTQSPMKKHEVDTPSPGSAREEIVGGDITLKMEPGKAPKLSRTASQKVVSRPPPLFLDLPDSTAAAKETFVVLSECTYANKNATVKKNTTPRPRQIMPVAKTPTASTARQRWSA